MRPRVCLGPPGTTDTRVREGPTVDFIGHQISGLNSRSSGYQVPRFLWVTFLCTSNTCSEQRKAAQGSQVPERRPGGPPPQAGGRGSLPWALLERRRRPVLSVPGLEPGSRPAGPRGGPCAGCEGPLLVSSTRQRNTAQSSSFPPLDRAAPRGESAARPSAPVRLGVWAVPTSLVRELGC